MNFGENCLSSELLSCGGSPFTTCVSWSKTLFHLGYGNLPVASSYWKQTQKPDEFKMPNNLKLDNTASPCGADTIQKSHDFGGGRKGISYQGDSQAPYIRADIVTLSRGTGVYSFRLKNAQSQHASFTSMLIIFLHLSPPSFINLIRSYNGLACRIKRWM